MKYNKKQRAKIYLEFAKSLNQEGHLDFICFHLYKIMYGSNWEYEYRNNKKAWKKEFLEFALFENIKYVENLDYWSFDYNSERIIALLFCYHMALEAEK